MLQARLTTSNFHLNGIINLIYDLKLFIMLSINENE